MLPRAVPSPKRQARPRSESFAASAGMRTAHLLEFSELGLQLERAPVGLDHLLPSGFVEAMQIGWPHPFEGALLGAARARELLLERIDRQPRRARRSRGGE